jgi:hypothetical protein
MNVVQIHARIMGHVPTQQGALTVSVHTTGLVKHVEQI